MTDKVLLGFEVKTAKPVYIPTDMNFAATGQTRRTGKTTALEGVFQRAKKTCLTFRTKRNEVGFLKAREIMPYYKPRADWVYVKSLAEAALDKELPGLYDRWFMEVTGEGRLALPHPETLQQVRENISLLLMGRAADKKNDVSKISPAHGFEESMLLSIRGYLDLVLPDLTSRDWSDTLDIEKGTINMMDLTGISEAVQSLIIASCIEEVNTSWEGVDIIVPEAPDYFPSQKGSPAKVVARRLAKKGGSINNHLHLDAQMIADVDPVVRSQARLWLLGPQQYEHEIERTLKLLPRLGKLQPKSDDVQTLPLGHFYLVIAEDKVVKPVYALPWWLPEEIGKKVALGKISPKSKEIQEYKEKAVKKHEVEVEKMWKEKAEGLEKEVKQIKANFEDVKALNESLVADRDAAYSRNSELSQQMEQLQREVVELKKGHAAPPPSRVETPTQTVRRMELSVRPGPGPEKSVEHPDMLIHGDTLKVKIDATTDRPMEFTTDNVRGQIMRVMSESIDPDRKGNRASWLTIRKQAQEYGYFISDSGGNRDRVEELIKDGALVKESDGYRLPSKAEFDIKRKEKKEAALA